MTQTFALERTAPEVGQILRVAMQFVREGFALVAGAGASLCKPLLGELACACSSLKDDIRMQMPDGELPVIEGWLAFPTAIADGTATGTVFLETNPQLGSRSRVIANLSVERGGKQNWIHFRMSLAGTLEAEGSYGLRATLVATDAVTGHKRLFGTTRAAPLRQRQPEAGIILELEDWG